jgi:hypothetical protein
LCGPPARVTAVDYADREVTWFPSPALGTIRTLPKASAPQVLVPSLHVTETDEIVRFKVEEESDFTEMWRNYPKRRKASAKEVAAYEQPVDRPIA